MMTLGQAQEIWRRGDLTLLSDRELETIRWLLDQEQKA